MHITIGKLELDNRHGLYVRLPHIGAGHYYPRLGWTWDWWSTLRSTGEV